MSAERISKWVPGLVASAVLIFLQASCTHSGSSAMDDPYGTGPFDADGTYREDWADDPTKWRRPGRGSGSQSDLLALDDRPPANATPLPSNRQSTAAATPAPRPKPKPQPVRYTVRKGDSLYVIARRYGTSVRALQRANGISGSLIRPGQRLVIPR